jgi:homoserine O-acetyltransferase/O-succinyltransferase
VITLETVMPSHSPDTASAGTETAVKDGLLERPGQWRLHHGGSLSDVRIAWRLVGPPQAPVVCALGGIWCDRQLFDLQDPRRGCWREVVGPGRPLDPRRVRILSFDYLGGSGATTGPTAGKEFPSVSTYDQAEVLARLAEHLGIASLRAIVGGSYGGMVALAFAERYPERVGGLVTISAADRAHPMAVAWHSIQRRIVEFAIGGSRGGEGLKLARAVALSLYRSSEEFAARFPPLPRQQGEHFVFPVEQYLFTDHGELSGFIPEAFLRLSESLDLHRVDADRIFVPAAAVAAREDQLVPLADVRALAARMGAAHLHEISSIHGHDAYLREAEQLRGIIVGMIAG